MLEKTTLIFFLVLGLQHLIFVLQLSKHTLALKILVATRKIRIALLFPAASSLLPFVATDDGVFLVLPSVYFSRRLYQKVRRRIYEIFLGNGLQGRRGRRAFINRRTVLTSFG